MLIMLNAAPIYHATKAGCMEDLRTHEVAHRVSGVSHGDGMPQTAHKSMTRASFLSADMQMYGT